MRFFTQLFEKNCTNFTNYNHKILSHLTTKKARYHAKNALELVTH